MLHCINRLRIAQTDCALHKRATHCIYTTKVLLFWEICKKGFMQKGVLGMRTRQRSNAFWRDICAVAIDEL